MHHKKQHDFLKQSFKRIGVILAFRKVRRGFRSIHSRREQEQEDIEIFPQKSIRPLTSLISPSHSYSSRQRPIIAPGLNVQVKHMMKIDENEEMVQYLIPYHSVTKNYRKTKNFDKTNQNVIRNHSTLMKISLEGESEIYNIEEEEQKNQNLIENRPQRSEQQLTGGFHQNATIFKGAQPQQMIFKHSSLQIQDNLVDIMKLINGQIYTKSPVIVRTKPQGLRPQSAVNKQIKVNQHYRPVNGKVQSITVRGFQL